MDDEDWMLPPAERRQPPRPVRIPSRAAQPKTGVSGPPAPSNSVIDSSVTAAAPLQIAPEPEPASLPPAAPSTTDLEAQAGSAAAPSGGLGSFVSAEGVVTMMHMNTLFYPDRTRWGLLAVFTVYLSYFFFLLAISSAAWTSSNGISIGMWITCYGGCSVLNSLRAEAVLTMIIGGAATLYWLVIAFSRVLGAERRLPLLVTFVRWTSFGHAVAALFGWNAVVLANAFFGSSGWAFWLWVVACIGETLSPCVFMYALKPVE